MRIAPLFRRTASAIASNCTMQILATIHLLESVGRSAKCASRHVLRGEKARRRIESLDGRTVKIVTVGTAILLAALSFGVWAEMAQEHDVTFRVRSFDRYAVDVRFGSFALSGECVDHLRSGSNSGPPRVGLNGSEGATPHGGKPCNTVRLLFVALAAKCLT